MPINLGEKDGSTDVAFNLEASGGSVIGKKTKKKTIYVLSDNLQDTEEIIITTADVPQLFDEERGIFVRSVKPKEKNRIASHPVTGVPCILWEVDINYDSGVEPGDSGGGGGSGRQNPLNVEAHQSWSGELVEEAAEADIHTGEAIVNVVGESLHATVQRALPTLTIQRIERYPFKPTRILQYVNHVNYTTFYGAPKGTALMLPIQADEEVINGRRYVNVSYTIQFKMKVIFNPGDNKLFGIKPFSSFAEDTWRLRLLNEGGIWFTDTVANARPVDWKPGDQPFLGATETGGDKGNPVIKNLTLKGGLLPNGTLPTFVEYFIYPYAEFSRLRLGP